MHNLAILLAWYVCHCGIFDIEGHLSEVYYILWAFYYQDEELVVKWVLVLEEPVKLVVLTEGVRGELTLFRNHLSYILSFYLRMESNNLDFLVISKEKLLLRYTDVSDYNIAVTKIMCYKNDR